MTSHDPGGAADEVEARVWDALEGVIDPELGLDVVTMGLVYEVRREGGRVRVVHTLTTPGCPMGEHITRGIRQAAATVPGVEEVEAEVTWEPAWDPGMIDDDAWES